MLIGNRKMKWIAVFSILALLTACGGGGGGNSRDSDSDPATPIEYGGITDRALITEHNAENLAIGSYNSAILGTATNTGFSKQRAVVADRTVIPFGHNAMSAMRRSVQKIYYQQGPERGASNKTEHAENVVDGNCGGSLSVAFDVDESTGEFEGSFDYQTFCEDGVTLDGRGRMKGVFEDGFTRIRQIRMTYNRISVDGPESSYEISGWIDVEVHDNDSETDRMDVVLQDGVSGKIYWIHDYMVTLRWAYNYYDVELSGQYFDPDEGYVDIRTEQPIRFDSNHDWPFQGVLKITGRDAAWVTMSYNLSGYCRFEADFDNDGRIDWTYDYWFPNPAGINRAPLADAGSEQSVIQYHLVQLDGGGSYDPDDDPITYRWSFSSCPSSCPRLYDNMTRTPYFNAYDTGNYEVELVVRDGHYYSTPDTVLIEVTSINPSGPELGEISDMVAGGDPQWVYAIDRNNQSLYFIDTQSHLITETITLLDTQPVALDYSPIDNSLYIVSAFSGSVTVVDLETNQISQLPFSQIYDGRDVAVAPELRRIYVMSTTEGSSSNLYILDMDSGDVLNESTIGGNAIVIDETAELIFTAGHGDGVLSDTFYNYSISDDRPELVQSTTPQYSGAKIAISPDGAHLVLPTNAGNGAGYTIYDFDAGNLKNVLGEWDVGAYPSGAVFSPDGSVFFGTNGDSYDNYLYVMDAATYRQIRKLRFPNADDYAVFTPNSDGTVVVGFSYDSYSDSGHGLYFFTDVQNEPAPSIELKKISDMVAGKDPQWVYAVDQDNQALYYINTQTQQIADTLVLPDTQPVAVDYSPADNNLYVVSAFSGDVTIVHLDDNQISKMPFSTYRDGRDIVVAPTLRRIYVLSPDGYDSDLSILDMDNGDVLSLTGIGGSSVVIDESSEVIFTANKGLSPATLYKYSVSSDQQRLLQSIRTGGNGRNVAISPDGVHVVLPCGGGNGPGYTIYDFDAGNLDNVFGEWDVGTYPTGAAFSPDGSIFFGINGDFYDNHLYVMDAAMYHQIRKLPFANSGDYAVFTPNSDGSVVVGFSYDTYDDSEYMIFYFTNVK